ncbi:MAG: hypothetical protein U5N58_01015 [Actinomycetota bacterium]|nr:hypothetical protein [Actinomycetota bacterium]
MDDPEVAFFKGIPAGRLENIFISFTGNKKLSKTHYIQPYLRRVTLYLKQKKYRIATGSEILK